MGIEDIQISEELETNAPSIKYRGDEGPKSPQQMQEMMMAQLEEEYLKYVDEMIEMGREPMSMQQFMDQAMAEGQMAGGNPLPQDPTKPVNPFQPKPTGPVLPDRQMAAYGGIMGLDGRRRYGLGSKFKKFVRKIIPNEVAEIAVKAAPFVAPFNPIAAGLMSGIGSFDQTGRIGSSLKSGLMNYGMGQLARGIGGGMDNLQGMSLKTMPGKEGFGSYFSSPIQNTGGIGKMFRDTFSTTGSIDDANRYNVLLEDELGADRIAKSIAPNPIDIIKKTKTGNILKSIKDYAMNNKLATFLLAKEGFDLLGGPEETVDEIMDRGEGLDVKSIRAEVIEAFKDSSGDKLAALRVKYPFLGRQDTKDMSAMAMGGRIGYADAGSVMKDPDEVVAGMDNELNPGFFDKLPLIGSSKYPLNSDQGSSLIEKIQDYKYGTPPPQKPGSTEIEQEGYTDEYGTFQVRDKKGAPPMSIEQTIAAMEAEWDIAIEEGYKPGRGGKFDDLGIYSKDDIRRRIELGFDSAKGPETQTGIMKAAYGGRAGFAEGGGIMDLGGMEKDYRAEGGFVPIGREEKADDVPARLSVNEFVFTADAVRNAGGGDIDRGAEVMENMMKHLEQGGQVSDESQGMAGAQQMFETSQRLSEVM